MRKTLWIAAATAAGALAAFGTTPAAARTFVDVQIGVPARVHVAPPAPRRGQLWVPGHWSWDGYRHAWMDGHFARARDGYDYRQPQWVRGADRWSYRPGNWQRRDRDGDGVRNRVDRDRDGDGVPNRFDRAPNNGRRY